MNNFRELYLNHFYSSDDKKSYDAFLFYERYADLIDQKYMPIRFEEIIRQEDIIDIEMLKAHCWMGKSYSHSRFMSYVAIIFGTTVKEMKQHYK